MKFRLAEAADVTAVAAIYEEIHSAEESGAQTIGWIRGVYPTRATAEAALARGDLFVGTDERGQILAAAVINRIQVDVYEGAPWRYPAEASEVMVLHTLVLSPQAQSRGGGRAFVAFYEDYARSRGCRFLRMDTNARNVRARAFYRKLGYEEIAVVPTVFNGIPDVNLVLLEKQIACRS